ncbi:MAG: patatin-like phospholipase family protein, partial [Deltaproteobacteria bacterium]|nr:patatin-like phospholipase family protein [Deltaproteobacteria bacterium]
MRQWAICVLACLPLVGCMTAPPKNWPLEGGRINNLAETSGIASPDRSGRILLLLTFSGGGTRAAAFSYGALQELAQTHIELGGARRRLFDEVDLVSAVSGGSFTAAYLGLHGDGIFDDYEDIFLRKNVQSGLIWEVLRPRYWLGLLRIDRSQLAANYYDMKIFHGAT